MKLTLKYLCLLFAVGLLHGDTVTYTISGLGTGDFVNGATDTPFSNTPWSITLVGDTKNVSPGFEPGSYFSPKGTALFSLAGFADTIPLSGPNVGLDTSGGDSIDLYSFISLDVYLRFTSPSLIGYDMQTPISIMGNNPIINPELREFTWIWGNLGGNDYADMVSVSNVTFAVTVTPEPGSVTIAGLGLLALAIARKVLRA
jgi:hypothetical protein